MTRPSTPIILASLLMMGFEPIQAAAQEKPQSGPKQTTPAGERKQRTTGRSDRGSTLYTVGNLSVTLLARAWGSPIAELVRKSGRLQELMPKAQITGPERVELESLGGRLTQLMNGQRFEEASSTLDRMLAIVGQRGDLPEAAVGADLARERSALVERARAAGADGVEDYIGWAVVETRPDQWDWSLYQENAREIRKAGLKYVPYVWVQNLPSWVRHGADSRFATCLEHGKASEHLSVFSPKTVEAYDRVFSQLKAALGTQIDALRIGSPTDFGETHYPAGNAAGAFPVAHIHIGWWAGEPEARQHFLRWVETKYGSVERLNAAWGTQFTRFRIRLSARSDPGAALARFRRVVSRGPHRAARGALRHRPQALPRDPDLCQSGLAIREDRSGAGPFGTGQDARLQEDDRSQPERPDGHPPLHAPGRHGRPVLPPRGALDRTR